MNVEFYTDQDKKTVDPELFAGTARRIAEEIARDTGGKAPQTHQIRRFYSDFLSIRRKIETASDAEEEFRRQLPYIRMAQAKAAYALQRGNINKRFQEFIGEVARIESRRDFEVFCTLFEAVIAYYPKR